MELEELRSIWKSSEPGFQHKDETEIAAMLSGRSLTIIDKLKRNVRLELALTLVVSVCFLYYSLTLPAGKMKWTSIAILLMCICFSFYYIKKIILLNRFDPAKENIRANLVFLIDKLSGFLKFYRRSYTVMYPVFFCLGLTFSALDREANEPVDNLFRPINLLYLIIMAVVLFLVTTWFVNWCLKKLYGNHLEKLKSLLRDIQGTESLPSDAE
jgi:cobalamin synthase